MWLISNRVGMEKSVFSKIPPQWFSDEFYFWASNGNGKHWLAYALTA